MNKKHKKMLFRIIISAILLVLLNIIDITGYIRLFSFLFLYLLIGYDILRKAVLGILHGRVFDENFLMAIATLGAFALALYQKSGDYSEAITVMLFYQIGELFQGVALGKSRASIASLMDIRQDYANIEKDGKIEKTDPETLSPGSIIVIQPGEKIPIDGLVISGESSIDTKALTGESVPRDVAVGDDVLSGCINMTGVLRVKTTRSFGESTVSKILELVENSSARKSKSEAFISKFAKVYTPIVCCLALALALLPPVVRLLSGVEAMFGEWIYRALTFLVISCPCALVISIPLGFFSGIGRASSEGILIKGSNYFETLSKVKTVVFDKTGTLTLGEFEVCDIKSEKLSPDILLEYAAYAECASSHPISKSIQKKYAKEIDTRRVCEIRELGGNGVIAIVDGIRIAAGNEKLMKLTGVECKTTLKPGTVIHIAANGEYAGYIILSDKIKPTSPEAISSLKSLGVKETVMLTGDSRAVAENVSENLGIDKVYSELLPSDKVEKVEMLLSDNKNGEKLAFVGDGINDAPVLSRADVGIAMGALGSDAAIEAADVVIMDDDPRKITKAISLSRKCLSIVYTNIVFSLVVKAVTLFVGALGYADMWLAIFADVGVMVLAVLNSVRGLYINIDK